MTEEWNSKEWGREDSAGAAVKNSSMFTPFSSIPVILPHPDKINCRFMVLLHLSEPSPEQKLSVAEAMKCLTNYGQRRKKQVEIHFMRGRIYPIGASY